MDIGWPYTLCSGIGYASWTGTAWQIEKFSDCGTLPSLVLDSLDRPHISFYVEEPGLVKYASKPAAGEVPHHLGDHSALGRVDRQLRTVHERLKSREACRELPAGLHAAIMQGVRADTAAAPGR